MEARPEVGDAYDQEHYEGVAEDRGEVMDLDATATTPYRDFEHMLKTRDTTPLEPDVSEDKYYAKGVGLVLEVDAGNDERVELVSVEHV
jgi:hypothetical protein